MRLSRILWSFALVLLPLTTASAFQGSAAPQNEISGFARVVDGDTLAFGRQRVRLFGIDAPESTQVCDVGQNAWRCGVASRDMLSRAIGGGEVTCQIQDRDPYGRWVAVCENQSGEDLNAWMVREGLAVAYVQYSRAYVNQEREARARGNGVWGGPFERPQDYRRHQSGSEDESSFQASSYETDPRLTPTASEAQLDSFGSSQGDDEAPKPTFRAMACAVIHKGC